MNPCTDKPITIRYISALINLMTLSPRSLAAALYRPPQSLPRRAPQPVAASARAPRTPGQLARTPGPKVDPMGLKYGPLVRNQYNLPEHHCKFEIKAHSSDPFKEAKGPC